MHQNALKSMFSFERFSFEIVLNFKSLKMKKVDPLTNESFVPQRINQRFASAINRKKWHTIQNRKLRHSLRFVTNPLQRNIRILNELMAEKSKTTWNKFFLQGKGMNLSIVTHFEKINDKSCPCIFHYAIVSKNENEVEIIKLKSPQ